MRRTEQEEFWRGEFGDEYTQRNVGDWDAFYKKQWGVTRSELNQEFLTELSKNARILEVGCNRGIQLEVLEKQGFRDLWGIEINKGALEIAKAHKSYNIVEASALDIPFKDGFFDLVFTSGVLIHIAPQNLSTVLSEIHRVTREYIWGFEYYSEECTEIEYRGHKNRLWKNDFSKLYRGLHPDLTLVKQRKIKYLEGENVDMMFLLGKKRK